MTKQKNKAQPNFPKKRKGIGWLVGLFWLLFLAGVGSVFFLFWGIANLELLGPVPDVRDLENPELNVPSEIYSSDGVLLNRFELERRKPVEFDDLPDDLVNGVISKEDERYFKHSGIDQIAVLRALSSLGGSGGGSTISQQLAKLLFSKQPRTRTERIKQKLKEWVLSVKLEKLYTKSEIIELYFNKFDFIYGAKGIEIAANTYFNKSAKDLTRPECAMLVAMLNNPVAFNPKRNPKRAYLARNRVLKKMRDSDFITNEELAIDSLDSVQLDFNRVSTAQYSDSKSGYYKYFLKKEINAYLSTLEQEKGKKLDLYRDGLKIYLTLDSRMQKMAEDAMKKHMTKLQKQFTNEHKNRKNKPFYYITPKTIDYIMSVAMKRSERYQRLKEKGLSEEEIIENFNTPTELEIFTWEGTKTETMTPMDSIRYHKGILRSGMMSLDPKTGQIKAWIGGIDWNHFKYDHVAMGRRQVGSTFKPFVYSTAIDQIGLTPCHEESNEKFEIGGWSPGNASGKYGGKLSLRDALAHSVNVVAARLIHKVKPESVIKTARMMGIKSPIKEDYTIALGSSDLTLYEMVGAFGTFANGGLHIRPELILKIEDQDGRIIKEYEPQPEEVFREEVAYTMVDLMRGVCKYGTARRVNNTFQADIAGKTGTTNDNSDGWFIGMTPNLVTGVWVGAEDRSAHFRSTLYGQGGYMALPIWINYMRTVYREPKSFGVSLKDKFKAPKGVDEWSCETLDSINIPGFDGIYSPFSDPTLINQIQASANENLHVEDSLDFSLESSNNNISEIEFSGGQ